MTDAVSYGTRPVSTSDTTISGVGSILIVSFLFFLTFGIPLFSFICFKVAGFYQCLPSNKVDAGCPYGYARYVAHEWLALGSIAVAFGALGVSVSAMSRLNNQEVRYQNFPAMMVVLLHLLGATFGLLIFLLFVGGLVQGSLFPDFSKTNGWSSLLFSFHDWAKLMVWCFLAGFSERLVPSLLQNVMGRANEKGSVEQPREAAREQQLLTRSPPVGAAAGTGGV